MKQYSDFNNLYSISKTLRFELIPQGKTNETIEQWVKEIENETASKNNLLMQDQQRAESYKKVKKIIDEYHKAFIDWALEGLELNLLQDYYLFYQIPKKEEKDKKQFADLQTKMRKQIAEAFTKHPKFKNLFGKELIKEDLKSFVKTEVDYEVVKEFDNFTTYFTGFHENRKNMYTYEEKSTAIAFRLIHQNLPKFIDNMRIFEKVRLSPIKEEFSHILSNKQLGPIVQQTTLDNVFVLDYFNHTLTQKGIDQYNHLIGGYTSDDGKVKIKGLNEYINLYNQKVKKSERLPKLKPLYKQILSDRISVSFIPEQFESDQAVLESVRIFYQQIKTLLFSNETSDEHTLQALMQRLTEFDLSKIFIRNDLSITDISQKLYGDYSLISKGLEALYDLNYKGKKKVGSEEYEEERKKVMNQPDSYSIEHLNQCLAMLNMEQELKTVEYHFMDLGKDDAGQTLLQRISQSYQQIKSLLENPYPENKNLSQQQKDVDAIKTLLDSLKDLQRFVKPLLGKGNEIDKDERFYGEFIAIWEALDLITPLYNKVRNYMTQKPYSTEKIKLNFENSYFLNGWDPDYETKAGLLFVKDGNYYLGINNKKLTEKEKLFLRGNNSDTAKRIILDFQKPDNKNIPRLFIRSKGNNYAPAVMNYNLPINEIIDIYDNGKFKTEYRKINNEDYLKSLHKLINYFKEGFLKHESYKHYKFLWKNTQEYRDIAVFYKDTEISCYQIIEEPVNWSNLMDFVNQGKLYLFKIYNKDFSQYTKGKPNIHTLYWKMLFDAENLKNTIYKLNGQAEVFFRKASIKPENIVKHPANAPITLKNKDNGKKQSTFDYDIIKDKRFTLDKFQFHVPITLNFKAVGTKNINMQVLEYLREQNDTHIIGIDRGERHLLYLSLIDAKGNIVDQYSLNEIVNQYKDNEYRTNYHELLDAKEKLRDEERRNWRTIENIKELKQGYLSQVIHKIASLMVEYKAIVVLEDLNKGFVRGRQKVEKSVYQQFEKQLINKLNYLVDKTKPNHELGGLLKALQLTSEFDSFKNLGKQSGFLFYIPAWNTSKMDPVTGFVNLLDTRYENMDKARAFFNNFDNIRYNKEKGYFEFELDYSKFTAKAEDTKTHWTLCTYSTRIETFRNPQKNNQWDSKEIVLTEEFKQLFRSKGIDYENALKKAIVKQNEKDFFVDLLKLLKLTLQMRNSITNTEIDYLISPVANAKGEFYDSRVAGKHLPDNADANGAYNIARKGLWVMQQIKNAKDLKKLNLAISNKEWLQFVQNRIV